MNQQAKVTRINGRTSINIDGYKFTVIDWNDAALYGIEIGEIVVSKDADGQWQASRRTADGLYGIDGDQAASEAFNSAVVLLDGMAAVDAHYESVTHPTNGTQEEEMAQYRVARNLRREIARRAVERSTEKRSIRSQSPVRF